MRGEKEHRRKFKATDETNEVWHRERKVRGEMSVKEKEDGEGVELSVRMTKSV